MKIVALLGASFILAAYLPAAPTLLPHYEVGVTVDTSRHTLAAVVKLTIPASEVQAVNDFVLGGTYKISSLQAGPRATAEVGPTDKPFPGGYGRTVVKKRFG